MTESSGQDRVRLRLGPLLRVLVPSLVSLILIVLLVFTMIFTDFDRQWVAFLAGILFASVLALISASLKSGWRAERRGAEAENFKERLTAEIEQHRGTREQLERELALHQQDRTRLAKEAEARRLATIDKLAAENLLAMLEIHLAEIAVFVDRDQRCRFGTREFSRWTGVASERINGLAFEEAVSPRDADALRGSLRDALDGRASRADVSSARRDGTEQRVQVDYLPQRDAGGQVSGALVLIKDAQSPAAAAPPDGDSSVADEVQIANELVIADESGNAVYFSSLTEELTGWGDPRERIRQAIQSDGFDLYAQDIVALRADTGARLMQELLIRMRDEEQNLVPPGTFLPIAERFGMMPDIDRFVVRKAVAARAAAAGLAAAAPAADYPLLCINLARASIEDRSFPEFVIRALERYRISGQSLCFEIADADAMACLPEASRFVHELKPLGCRFTLDGFGGSGINFDHVKVLPLDFLKIDGSIILQITRVPEALAKVRAIQRVCKVIGIRTVAEMVESDESVARLRAVEVDYVQGFGIAKPQPF